MSDHLRVALVRIANSDYGPVPRALRRPQDVWLWKLCKAEDTARKALRKRSGKRPA